MTVEELIELATEKLDERKEHLKILGKRPYDGSARATTPRVYSISLSWTKTETIEDLIDDVLNELEQLKGGFWMSEPPDDKPVDLRKGYEARTVRAGDLNLRLVYGFTITDNTNRLRVQCWYYPVSTASSQG